MIVVGTLVKYKTDDKVLAQIVSLYTRRPIRGVAGMTGMVKLMYMSGTDIGKQKGISTESFYHFWEVIDG